MATEIVNNKNNLSPWTSSKKEKSKSYKDTRNLKIYSTKDGTILNNGIFRNYNLTPEKVVYQKDGIYKGTNLYKINGKWYDDSGKEITKFRAPTSKPSSNAKPKQQQASGNSTGERKPAASSERKPATASAPRSNFSTPTPTYYTSLEKGITGHGLSEDLKKYLESLGVSDVSGLQTKLGGLTVDGKWGRKTQDAFTAGYNAWKNQQQERPQQLFDYNQLFSQWDQWMRQLPRQQQEITPMPATYDRYDIRHWLRENGIKGITAGGRKALRHYLNGEDYDTRYLGIVDLYAPMIRGNLRSTSASTPTMDPKAAEYFQNLIGTSFNDLPAAYNNLRTKGNVDDMYAPEYSTFHKVYDWAQNNPNAFLLAKLNMDFAKNAVEAYYLNNPLAQLPAISTPPYRVSTDTHTNPMLSNRLFLKVSDWANLNLNLKDYSSNNLSALFAKEGGYIPKFQNPAYPIWRRKINFAKGGDTSMNWMVRTVLEELWKAGAFKGIKNRRGKAITHDEAVDGLMGSMTRRAINNAKKVGMAVSNVTNTTARGISQMTPFKSNKPKTVTSQSKTDPAKSALEYAYAPGTTPSVVNQLMLEVGSKIGSEDKEIPEEQQGGHAIYLHYPNFVGNSANALKIGDLDVGAAIGNPSIPVGHDAFVLVGPDGTANYYEYGRYNSGPIIGHKRPTVKGGNWRRISLPALNPEENDSVYMSRVQSMLPDTKTGAYLAMTIPHVDTEKATLYIYDLANDPNRKEYGIDNTCATGACKATLPFRTEIESHPLQGMFNWGGYSLPAAVWSLIPGSTDSYATTAREAASNVYVMNDKSDKKK